MKEAARQARAEGRVIGFVPTMGALHQGHTALVHRAKQNCAPVIASIFVNPKQFGPNEDFTKYPRSIESDSDKFSAAGVDTLFLPDAAEIYPSGFRTYVTVEALSDRLEGRSRPGHFRGVATVVLKLLEIVQPHFAYFGRKDAQQVRIISQMVRDLNLDTEIVVCPIVREPDGLALMRRSWSRRSGICPNYKM
jgi:pantoate--beta-alanine ligase